MFKSAGSIVKGVISEHRDEVVLPKQMNMQRNANRYRQKLRPQDPKVLTDVLSYEFMPKDFLQDEISEKRHLFFATQDQLDQLKQTKRWYLDGTFKVVKAPYTQLLTIHAFIKQGDAEK